MCIFCAVHFAEQTVATKVVRKLTVGGLFVTGNYNPLLRVQGV